MHLINGYFNSKEALDLLTQLVHVKVKFHESKITNTTSEEDIKTREKRIKDLQRELFELRQYIEKNELIGVSIQADIQLQRISNNITTHNQLADLQRVSK